MCSYPLLSLPFLACVACVAAQPSDESGSQDPDDSGWVGWVSSGGGGAHSSSTFPAADQCATRLVCDDAQLLSPSVLHELNEKISSLASSGSLHDCGAAGPQPFQFGIATLERLDAASGEDIKMFTERLFNKWGLGHGECNDGVLLTLSRDDRKNYIKTGAGARGVLLDNHAAAILASLRPDLRNGDYDAALSLAVKRVIEEALGPGQPPVFYRMDRATFGILHMCRQHQEFGIAFVALALFVVHGWVSALLNTRRRLEFERKLRRLDDARLRLSKRDGHGTAADEARDLAAALDRLTEDYEDLDGVCSLRDGNTNAAASPGTSNIRSS